MTARNQTRLPPTEPRSLGRITSGEGSFKRLTKRTDWAPREDRKTSIDFPGPQPESKS